MSLLDAARYRLRVLLRARDFTRERDEEIRHHFELEASNGNADDARRTFGNTTYSAEERRMISGLATFDSAAQDLRFVSRLLRRRATFAAVTVATIGLGIGAAASIYSVADAVLFRSLSFPEPERLMSVHLARPSWKRIPDIAKRWDRGGLSIPGFRQWRKDQQSFDDVAIWTSATSVITDRSVAEEATLARASASLLATLGIRPALGAWIGEANEVVGGAPVAVIGYDTWMSRFGGDPDALGKQVTIDGAQYTIIGIAPRGLSLDRGPANVAYWIPAGRDSVEANDRSSFGYEGLARLKRGVAPSAARAEAGRIMRAMANDDRIETASMATLHDDQTRKVRQPLLVLLGASVLLLAVACINVATLLLGEAAAREQELRTRAALGAGRGRLLRQLLTESLALSMAGAALGLGLAAGATRLIVRAAPPTIPGLADVHVDFRVVLVASAAAIITGVLFGLVPAFLLTRATTLGMGGARLSARGRGRSQRALIACEIALSMILLVGAGLLLRSFGRLSTLGFEATNLYVVTPRLARNAYEDSVHARQLYARLRERISRMPDVAAVTVMTTPPFRGGSSTSYQIEGRAAPRGGPSLSTQRRSTTPNYFATMGIPLLAGRTYDDRDRAGAPLVVVVSQTLARREWPGESAVGKRINFMGQWRTIVGVVGDITTERPSAEQQEMVYAPFDQFMARGTPALIVRTRGEPLDVSAVRSVISSVEASVTIARVSEMESLVGDALADDRLRTVLFTVFAALAALLAGVGTYGVAATSASRRMREMAIRIAVGASNASIMRLVIGGSAAGIVAGAAVGLGLAAAGSRWLAPYLFGVGATDPGVYALVALLLAAATLVASWIPARRATRVRLVETLAND